MITFTRLEQVPVGIQGARLGGVSYVIADDPDRMQYYDLDLVVFAAVKLWGKQDAGHIAAPTVQTVLTFTVVSGGHADALYVPVSAFKIEPWSTSPGKCEPSERAAVARAILNTLPHYHRTATPVVFE